MRASDWSERISSAWPGEDPDEGDDVMAFGVAHAAAIMPQIATRYYYALHHCESPIERALVGAVAVTIVGMACRGSPCLIRVGQERWIDMETGDWHMDTVSPAEWSPSPPWWWRITPQAQVGRYRADALVSLCGLRGTEDSVVVECDGHDYHERTKEQARRDRRRDRAMQQSGLVVLRYTGSEIWGNVRGCAEDVVDTLWAMYRGRGSRAV